jgi:O-antigen ligase
MRVATTSTAITEVAELRLGIRSADALLLVGGTLFTFMYAYEATVRGGIVSLGTLLALGVFAATTYAFLVVPHLAVAVTIPVFALLPAAKVLVTPQLGPMKDGIVLAAIVAAMAMAATRRRSAWLGADRWLIVPTLFLLFLYVVNVAGSHNIAWIQGVRLFSEPLLLLLAGLALPQPQRTLRWAISSLLATACFVAGVGLAQQAIGQWRLHDIGFAFNRQIRTIQGHLRSFGTMEEPFDYASFLALAFAACLFALRRSLLAVAIGTLLLVGLAAAYVRTSVLIVFALLALELARRGRTVVAGALAAAVVVTAVVLVANSRGTESRTYANPTASATITLNGRTSAWRTALGSPLDWPFGRGVGEVGTAAVRAGYKIAVSGAEIHERRALTVDSGYFATIADVGLVGLVLLLALFGRAAGLARAASLRGGSEGWIVLAAIAVIMIDALTRSSFTGFPSAFLGMLLIGVALAAAKERYALAEQG